MLSVKARFLFLVVVVGTAGLAGMAGLAGCGGAAPPGMNGDGGGNGNTGNGDGGNGDAGNGDTGTGDGGNGDTGNGDTGDGGGDLTPPSTLYVVNNDGPSVTFFTQAESLNGEIVPDGEVGAGAATSLFQPRSIVVTNTGRMLVSRQNGGIVGYSNALVLNENTTADLVVDGTNTLLEAPIAFVYDLANDRLFVGNASGEDGILVFDNVSDAAFDGEVVPSRTFGPPDRTPFGTLNITVDALALDANGDLYVSDSQGDLSVNRDRVLVFTNPGAASGSVTPARTIKSAIWGQHQDIFVDNEDVLYVVDATNTVCMFSGASTLNGEVSPTTTLVVNVAFADLQGVVVTRNGTGLLADRGQDAIYSYDNIADRSGTLVPDRVLEGFDSQLRGPRQLWLVEDNSQN